MRHTIITLLSLLTTTAQAQQPNLNDPALNGVELDFIKLAAANRVGVYADLTYWNFLAVRYHGWRRRHTQHHTTRRTYLLVVWQQSFRTGVGKQTTQGSTEQPASQRRHDTGGRRD